MPKKLTLSFFFLACLTFLISSANIYQSKSFIFTFLNEEPALPEIPYEYSDINFPDHISINSATTGYYGSIDTTILDFIDDDISTLGRVLFYDEKLSALENMSCASCHKQEFSFAENVDFSEGISTLTTRNSLQLNDLGWSNNDGFFWDMEFSNMEDMISIPFKDENEIGANMAEVSTKMLATEYYPELFEKAFGDIDITEERIIDALTNFISSMVTFNSRFDDEANIDFQGFTEEENLGKDLFTVNCATCHIEGSQNTFFTNFDNSNQIVFQRPFLFSNGLEADPEDLGVGDWMNGFSGLYKLPTMRNIEITAPYMHDGSLETLDEVIDFYSEDVVFNDWNSLIPEGGFQFTPVEKDALKAFLVTLTDDSFTKDPKWSNPFPASPVNNHQTETIELQVSPNPMVGYALIELENSTNAEVSLHVYNNTGSLIKQDKFIGNQYELDKGNMIPGVYSILLQTGNKKNTIRLIVQ